MNRSNYSATTLSVYEIIGAYFADIFYTHLYHQARDAARTCDSSLTDEYKNAMRIYYKGLSDKNGKYYEKTIKDILDYYRVYTKFSTMKMVDFIDKIVQQFVPEEHFIALGEKDKYFFLSRIILDIVKDYINIALKIKMLSMVIDNHDDEEVSRECKQKFVDIQCMEREKIYAKFVKQELAPNTQNETVDIELFEKMREDRDMLYERVQKALAEKYQAYDEIAHLQKEVDDLKKSNTTCDHDADEIDKLRSEIARLNECDRDTGEIDRLRNENKSLQVENKSLRNEITKRDHDIEKLTKIKQENVKLYAEIKRLEEAKTKLKAQVKELEDKLDGEDEEESSSNSNDDPDLIEFVDN